MSARYQLNLATRPLRRHRTTNLTLLAVLALFLGFIGWQAVNLAGYADGLNALRAQEREARAEWEFLNGALEAIETRLTQPDAVAELEETRFLSAVVERQRFSWTRLLREIERTIPAPVALVRLTPEVSERGPVRLSMEARSETVEALTRFMDRLQASPVFDNLTVSVEELGVVEGEEVRRMFLQVDYMAMPAATEEAQP